MVKKINNQSVQDIVALSPTQEGILYHCLREPHLPLYVSQVALHIEGELQPALLQQALNQLVQNNDCLRSVIRWETLSQPVQIVLKEQPIILQLQDWSLLSETEQQNAWTEAMRIYPERVLDLEKGPLLRGFLYQTAANQYKLLVQFHHIIIDGWSLGVMLSEWLQTYEHILSDLPLKTGNKQPYKTYIKWLQQYDQEQARQFWQTELQHQHSHTRLPSTQQNGVQESAVHHVEIPLNTIMPQVENIARRYNVTANAIINAAWGLLLQRYNDSDEAIYGLTVSGRPDDLDGVEQMIGLFINTIPIVIREPKHLSAREYIVHVHNQLIRLKQAEHLSLSDIQSVSRFKGAEPLFNHILVFENYPLDEQLQQGSFSQFSITGYEELEINHYDMTVSFLLADQPVLKIEYHAHLFDQHVVQQLGQHFLSVLNQLTSQPDISVSDITILTNDEQYQLLNEFNQTERTFAKQESTVYELFIEKALAFPEYDAVVYKNDHLSYKELARRATILAACLRNLGGSEGKIVALLMDWSTDMITAIMGVLGSECAYLPIDPNYPAERIRYIVENSQAQIVITMPEFETMAANIADTVVVLNDGDCHVASNTTDIQQTKRVVDFPLAYVIYTSGSTGHPKGVMIDQKSFTEFILWTLEEYEHRPGYQVLLSNSYAFDSSIQQIFSPLVSGGTLHLIHPDIRKNAEQYLNYLQQHRINSIDEIPVLMNVLVEQAEQRKERPVLPDLTSLSLGSEYVPIQLVRKCREILNPTGKIINGYGPAETTVETSTYHFDGQAEQEISLIGKPRSNLKVYIVDQQNRLCPIGVAGEICVSGLGLSRGYLGRPELTAERFITNPFNDIHHDQVYEKMYKTGDAGQWQPDGNIQYIGRIDNQVKIRGYRVEMGEIEDALLQHDHIQDAVVVMQQDQSEPILCAFLKSSVQPEAEELQTFLTKRLPAYMIPSFFEYVDAYPLNPNGKIDRKVLEKTSIVRTVKDHSQPRHETDRKLVAIWSNILQLPQVGIYSNFFELGGNSIQIMRVYSQIKKQYPESELEISDLFSHNTIAQLSDYLLSVPEDYQKATTDATAGTASEEINLQTNKQTHEKEVSRSSSNDLSADQDIAIIGLGIRLPEIEGPDEFWEMLVQAKGTIRDIPDARKQLDPTGYADKKYLKYGYMDKIDEFDPALFGISPKLARSIDPNQRVMLETAYLTLEDAGYGVKQLHNRPVGVFMGGVLPSYYHHLDLKVDELMSSNLPANLAGRISYHFGFNGPAMVIETACSSSLTAVHTAVQAMRNQECELALVGGIHLDIEPIARDYAMESNIVSPSESCRAFSEEADGTIGGEGSICILLKPKAQALQDNDRIYAVIKGSAVTQDGARSNGITAPSPDAQAETIQRAWKNANIDPLTISYIEAHGTGTRLGDPIEIKGIQKAYRPYTTETQFIQLGSVKSNVGHLDSAAGLAGLIKTALCLRHEQLPASLHAQPLNSLIDFAKSPVQINEKLTDWKSSSGQPLRAGVSSFGLSGTNVHIILEQCTESSVAHRNSVTPITTNEQPLPVLITLSGATAAVVQRKVSQLKQYVQQHQHVSLHDLSYTLNCRRDDGAYKIARVASNVSELITRLDQIEANQIQHTASEQTVYLWLDNYLAGIGIEQLYHQLLPTGWISEEWQARYDEQMVRLAGHADQQARLSYAIYIGVITELIKAVGIYVEVAGTGVGAAIAAYMRGEYTWSEVLQFVEADKPFTDIVEPSLQDWIQQPGVHLKLLETNNAIHVNNGLNLLLQLLAKVYEAGQHPNFNRIQTGHVLSLPGYPFEHKSYWLDMQALGEKQNNLNVQQPKRIKQEIVADRQQPNNLFYQLNWQPTPLDSTDLGSVKEKEWILLVRESQQESNRWERSLSQLFEQKSIPVVYVTYGNQYRQLDINSYEIDKHNEQHIATLLGQLQQNGQTVTVCIHIAECAPFAELAMINQQLLSEQINESFTPAWHWTKQLGSYAEHQPVRLFHITSNTDRIVALDALVNPLSSMIVSLSRSANHEYAGLQSYCLDIPATDLANAEWISEQIYNELFSNDFCKEIAYRQGVRYVKYLDSASMSASLSMPLVRQNGVYIVTGGTGGIAEAICLSMAEQYRVTFILLGRTEPSLLNEKQTQYIATLTNANATVHYMKVNIARADEVEVAIQHITAQHGTINGVIHTAGIIGQHKALHELTQQDYEEVYEAKVYGTLLLDQMLREHMLDFFISFSSVDSVLSEKNLGPYSSANYFMDQYVLRQRQLGRQFISIRWGGWQFTGMGSMEQNQGSSHLQEIARLSPLILGFSRQQGVQAFWDIIAAQSSHLLVTGLDQYDIQALNKQAFFKISSELNQLLQVEKDSNTASVTATIEEIEATVSMIWTRELELEQAPDAEENYFSIGGDSILGIDIAVELSQIYKLQLDANTLFRYDTIRSLSKFIYDQLQSAQPTAQIKSIPKAVPVQRT
ncbi:non-ribosomal peptide synthetase [Paenibacillus nicotianae]|uniref:Non-ribosomal peptide synthetase n=1 Tax=Paenibacillus nicotianae TaxID=1526551 RepID=A0ABW4UTQ0_9BACL